MNPEHEYFTIVSRLLREIKLKSLGLPKNPPPPEPEMGYHNIKKPHGVEFQIQPQTYYTLLRNIVYKLQEENHIKILNEMRGDGLDGTRFIVFLNPSFDEIYNLHEKGIKISKKLEDKNFWTQANFQNGEIHFLVGEKEKDDGRHIHIILGKAGDIRIDSKDQSPSELVSQILAVTTKKGQEIKAELKFMPKD